jgi:hypothetical protein
MAQAALAAYKGRAPSGAESARRSKTRLTGWANEVAFDVLAAPRIVKHKSSAYQQYYQQLLGW